SMCSARITCCRAAVTRRTRLSNGSWRCSERHGRSASCRKSLSSSSCGRSRRGRLLLSASASWSSVTVSWSGTTTNFKETVNYESRSVAELCCRSSVHEKTRRHGSRTDYIGERFRLCRNRQRQGQSSSADRPSDYDQGLI